MRVTYLVHLILDHSSCVRWTEWLMRLIIIFDIGIHVQDLYFLLDLFFEMRHPLRRRTKQITFTIRPTASRPVYLGVELHLRPKTRFLLLSDSSRYVDMASPLWQEDGACRLKLLLILANARILRSESSGTHDHVLLSQICKFPNLEGQVSCVFPPGIGSSSYIYHQTLSSLFVASYDSQGYGGGIGTRLHTTYNTKCNTQKTDKGIARQQWEIRYCNY